MGNSEYKQLTFSFMRDYCSYIPPDYIKFYTVYQYDRIKFKKLLRKEVKKLKPKSEKEFKEMQDRILIRCYIRDSKGRRKRDTDEKHIYRYRVLDKIYEQLYNLGCRARDYSCLVFFDDEKQAMIKGTEDLPVFERVKIHIRLLRRLYEQKLR